MNKKNLLSSAFWWACCEPEAWWNSIWGQLQERHSAWIFQVQNIAQNHHFISLQTHQLFWGRRVLRLLCTWRRPRSLLAISPRGRISCFPGLQVFGERRRLSLSRLQVRDSCKWGMVTILSLLSWMLRTAVGSVAMNTTSCNKQFDLQLTISFVTTQDGSDNSENSNLQLLKFCECVSFHHFLLLANSQYLFTECE